MLQASKTQIMAELQTRELEVTMGEKVAQIQIDVAEKQIGDIGALVEAVKQGNTEVRAMLEETREESANVALALLKPKTEVKHIRLQGPSGIYTAEVREDEIVMQAPNGNVYTAKQEVVQ
jgi:hypothetical protein